MGVVGGGGAPGGGAKRGVVCRFFLAGNCKNGRNCGFLHEGPGGGAAGGAEEDEYGPDEDYMPGDDDHLLMMGPGEDGEFPDPDFADLDPESRAFMEAMFEAEANEDFDEDPNQLCELHIEGRCGAANPGECFYVHGDLCPHCGLAVLHPFFPEESAQHVLQCEEQMSIIEQLKASRDMECGICLERPVEMGRKFGLLDKCNHHFCLDCIRSWRTTVDQDNNVVRACPQCRVLSYFITPCAYVPQSEEHKAALLEAYKEKLGTIPCKYYNQGEGCPFGSSCFYKHKARGEPEVDPALRKTVGASGSLVIPRTTLGDYVLSNSERRQ